MRIAIFIIVLCLVRSSEPGPSHALVDSSMTSGGGRFAERRRPSSILHSVVVKNPEWNSVQVYEAVKPLWEAAGVAAMTYPTMQGRLTLIRRELGLSQKRDPIPPDQVAYLKVELITNPGMTPKKLSANLQALFGQDAAPHNQVVSWLKCARRTDRNTRDAEGEKVKVPIRDGIRNQMNNQRQTFLEGVLERRPALEEASRGDYAALGGEAGPNTAAIQPVIGAASSGLLAAAPSKSRASSSQRQRSRSHSPAGASAGLPTKELPALALASMHQHGRSLWTKRHSAIAMDVYRKSAGNSISIAQLHRWCSNRFTSEGLSPITYSTYKAIWKDIRPTPDD